jgi:phospholipid/cholesterol/gamma-HCH transport system substrate-binding protein
MERDANYALVGVVSLAIFVGLVAFVVWLAGFSFNRQYDEYDVIFIGPVRGLSQGGEVHFNGIKVGEVTDISLDPKDPNRVIARARLKEGVPVRVDSFATLEPQGITGVNYVQITAGTPSKPLLKSTVPKDAIPAIRSQKSALSDLLEGGGTVLQRTVQALDQVNKLLTDENVRSLSASLHNVEDLTADLKGRKKMLDDLNVTINDLDKTVLSIKQLADSSNTLVNTDGKRTLSNLADAAQELKATAQTTQGMIKKLEGPTVDFATNGLPELSAAVTSLQRSAEALNGLVNEVRASPRSLIGKAPAKEVEVQP